MIASFAFLFITLASYSNADYSPTKHIDAEFEDETYTNYPEIPKLDDARVYGPNAARNFYIVVIFGLFALQINLYGSLYVIYRTYLQLRRGGRSNIPLSLRFPFYIALTDALLSLTYTVNLSYTLVWKLPWANPTCKIIGASVTTLFISNMFLVGIIALTTYSYVCREYYIEFGTYDYRLWIVTFALSSAVIAVSIDKSGQQKYWCAGRHHSIFVPLAMIIFIVVILITTLTSYIKVLLKIRNNDNALISSYQRPIEKRALRKLISYIFTFILQFIPLLTYYFCILGNIENIFLDVLAITTLNFGGIGNFVQFAINEGLWSTNNLNSLTSSIEHNMQSIPKATISVAVREENPNNIDNFYDKPVSIYTFEDNNDLLSPEEEKSNEDIRNNNNNTNENNYTVNIDHDDDDNYHENNNDHEENNDHEDNYDYEDNIDHEDNIDYEDTSDHEDNSDHENNNDHGDNKDHGDNNDHE